MNNADSDLIYLMEDAQLSLALQHKIVTVGFKTLRQFAGMEETRAAVRLLATSVSEVAAELKGTRRDKFRLRCVHEVSYRSLGCRYAPIRPCALAHAGPGLARPTGHKM